MTTIAFSLALASLASTGQGDSLRSGAAIGPTVHASRVGGGAIVMDGMLSEAAWSM